MVVKIKDKEYKVGVGITTYQRFDRFKECFENLITNSRDVDEILIVDDCSQKDRKKYDEYFKKILFNHIKVMRSPFNSGVGVCKNTIMRYFYDKGFDYFFTLEDDINVIHCDVFRKYIEASIATGWDYWNFAEHGTHNKTHLIKTKDGYNFKVYPNIVGAFTMYTPRLITEIGYHDESFFNAMEHVEYTYRASLKGLTNKFWQFIDITDNVEMLEEQEGAIDDSSIRPKPDWQNNVARGYVLFQLKHGVDLFNVPR